MELSNRLQRIYYILNSPPKPRLQYTELGILLVALKQMAAKSHTIKPGSPSLREHHTTSFLSFTEKGSELLYQAGNRRSPPAQPLLYLQAVGSPITCFNLFEAHTLSQAFSKPQTGRNQHAGYRDQSPGGCTILSLSSQLPRQLDLGHNGRKQQPLLADSSQHAAGKISACLSWKSSEHIPSITSQSSKGWSLCGLRRLLTYILQFIVYIQSFLYMYYMYRIFLYTYIVIPSQTSLYQCFRNVHTCTKTG